MQCQYLSYILLAHEKSDVILEIVVIMNVKSLVADILSLQDASIGDWYQNGVRVVGTGVLELILENHAFNFKLWLAEDKARRDDKGFEFVYNAKREIDSCNQQRNNKMEEIDAWLFANLSPAPVAECKLNSETPGMIIDRLSILSLKLYHMRRQAERVEVGEDHQRECAAKVEIILLQKQYLAECLADFLEEIVARTRTFKVYRQFKMYNDPKLNPQLY